VGEEVYGFCGRFYVKPKLLQNLLNVISFNFGSTDWKSLAVAIQC